MGAELELQRRGGAPPFLRQDFRVFVIPHDRRAVFLETLKNMVVHQHAVRIRKPLHRDGAGGGDGGGLIQQKTGWGLFGAQGGVKTTEKGQAGKDGFTHRQNPQDRNVCGY